MQSINNVLLHSDRESKNEVNLGNGKTLILDTTFNPERNAVQKLEVLSPALKWDYDIKKGDFLYVHHFICMNGSDYLWSKKEGIYWCPKDFVYARVRKGKVKMLGNWNFIRPIITEPPRSESGIYLTSEPKAFAFRKGIVAHMSDGMKELGLKIGDKIGFSKNSEYDMEIEGEKLYRMRDKDILYKIEE